jgi:hypothetical protein
MKNLSMMHYFLGQEVCQMTDKIFRVKEKYTVKILKKKIDDNSDEIDPQLIGSLMYLVNTRLYSFHAVNVPDHFMSQPRQTH